MPVLAYSLLRILLIVAAGGGLYLAGMRGVLLLVGAVLVGALLSYVLLDRFRRASAEWLSSRGRGRTRWEDRLSSDADDEDALLGDDGTDPTDPAGQGDGDALSGDDGTEPAGQDDGDTSRADPRADPRPEEQDLDGSGEQQDLDGSGEQQDLDGSDEQRDQDPKTDG